MRIALPCGAATSAIMGTDAWDARKMKNPVMHDIYIQNQAMNMQKACSMEIPTTKKN